MADSSDRTGKRLLDSIRKAKTGETNPDTTSGDEIQPSPSLSPSPSPSPSPSLSPAEPTPPAAPRSRPPLAKTAPGTGAAAKPTPIARTAARPSSTRTRAASAKTSGVRNAVTAAPDPGAGAAAVQDRDLRSRRVWPD
ncbi:MAG: hypothetical protein EOM91_08635 [Sphingobacteriia bacterium]|nr:hypothetical protein [Sphingobacteriia bacterium]NCC40109.1 hypothetical protein [Gammaproteobacteria bacterium]